MHLFCSQINTALDKHFAYVDVRFHKNYILILNELMRLNLIKSFFYNKYFIRIFLRYVENRQIFLIKPATIPSRKLYFNSRKIYYMCKNNGFNIDIFSSDIGCFSEKNVLLLKEKGGLFFIKIIFFQTV